MMNGAEDDPRNITESPNESGIQMEVVKDVLQHQKQTQQQSEQNIQLTQTRPYSNAERQKRYREKRKADKMNACATFSQSSDEPQHDLQINKPQSNAERQRKYRKSLREKQQQHQQLEDINTITVLSNTPYRSSIDQLQNVDQAERARKRHLNKLRQSRFRARQRFKSPSTSSHQTQAERPTKRRKVVKDPTPKEKKVTVGRPNILPQILCDQYNISETENIDLRTVQFDYIDHVVLVYLNRCRSRANNANVGMPQYILKGKAQEAAILLGARYEDQFHWIEKFKKKIVEHDAKGIVLTPHHESINIQDIICDEWRKYAREKGYDIGGNISEETISVVDEEEYPKQTENLTLNNDDDQTQTKTSKTNCSRSKNPENKKMEVICDHANSESKVSDENSSDGHFLKHVLMVFIRRFNATWPQADIPDIILNAKFREAALILGSKIKNKNVWLCAFKLNLKKKTCSETILTEPNQSLDINEIIEEERPKFCLVNNISSAEVANLSAASEVAIANETNIVHMDIIKEEEDNVLLEVFISSDPNTVGVDVIKEEEQTFCFEDDLSTAEVSVLSEVVSDTNTVDNNAESFDVIHTYAEARDCLKLLNNYALELRDLNALALIYQADSFLRSEDFEE